MALFCNNLINWIITVHVNLLCDNCTQHLLTYWPNLQTFNPSDLLIIYLKKIFLFILLWPRSVFSSSRENYSELFNRNQKWCIRTFQDLLLVLFVILSNHMTNPIKKMVSCFTGLLQFALPWSYGPKKEAQRSNLSINYEKKARTPYFHGSYGH